MSVGADWTAWDGRSKEAPRDWDMGPVLLRKGTLGMPGYWDHKPDMPEGDIVGYHTVSFPFLHQGVEVTEADWRASAQVKWMSCPAQRAAALAKHRLGITL